MTLLDARLSKPLKGGASYSFKHRLLRAFWKITWNAFAVWTPPFLHRWRVFLLNCFGAKVDKTAHVYSSVSVWYPPNLILDAGSCLGPDVKCYSMAIVHVKRGAVISQGTHICAGLHDIEDPNFQLVVKPIYIGASAWIAAECFIGPGVNVGDGAVLGARTVLFSNAETNGVYVGNPARLIKYRSLFNKI
jgi:putative colanic acid biosynthesis acetyltransferase WcaF